jgi:dTDP-glucose 4,6-dehydratase
MKTYLITGGAGFIGSNFTLYMLKRHEDVRLVNLDALTYAGNLENLKDCEGDSRHIFVRGDVTDAPLVGRLFREYDFDYVVNFAAESHVDRSIKDPGLFMRTNVGGTITLLDAAKTLWAVEGGGFSAGKKFLQVSTDEVYGSLGAEGWFTETTPLNPHSPYAASKASADLFVRAYFDTYGLPVNITRCSNNYGPFQFPEKLIPLMYNNCLTGKSLPVYGDGRQIRDWLYVDDHCRAIDLVLEKGRIGEVYNIGGHNERFNIDVVRAIVAFAGASESLITHVQDRLGHDRRYGIDASKISGELGWAPETVFEDGVGLTLSWYRDNQAWLERVTDGAYRSYYDLVYGNLEA